MLYTRYDTSINTMIINNNIDNQLLVLKSPVFMLDLSLYLQMGTDRWCIFGWGLGRRYR